MCLGKAKIVLIVFAVVFVFGCAETQLRNIENEYRATLDPMIGKSGKEDFVRMWGLPADRQTFGHSEFWLYRKSYGSQGGGQAFYNPLAPTFIGPTVSTRTWEAYDEITLEFDKYGFLKYWRLLVQR